jgi:hypothetical protein
MDCILKMPANVNMSLLGSCPVESREYAVLKNSVVAEPADRERIIETICELHDAELLLAHAKQFYPEAVPYILKGLSPDGEAAA